MDLRRAPPAPSRERKGQKREARPLRCGGGMAGRGGPLGPYFRATPVPQTQFLRYICLLGSQRVPRISLGSAFGQARGGRFDFKIAVVRQNSIWPTGVADQIRTRGAPQSRHALIAVFAALAPLDFVSLSSISRRAGFVILVLERRSAFCEVWEV